ncbi:hypothetical protein, variant 1 [Aphanomyces astaci]|uniref:Uncharacterized protein n=1 Tax=Aphanomyces astaci TaxID=112090 RepID=W4FN09_APHAT|nr:hypothetical protein, variant 1 [Aphanomyces astaci]ETV68897.1 hypothetical protein, variant 1 [Aphanomyces astaci]|eukprot:XP_009841574.1 hypothetical protein, variant 1 [Aphanomyces astaci]
MLLHLVLALVVLYFLLLAAPMWWFEGWWNWISRWRLRPIGHATLLATDSNHAPILTVLMVVQGAWSVDAVASLVSKRMAADSKFFSRFCSRVRVDSDDFELVPGFDPATHVTDMPLDHRHETPLQFAEFLATQDLDIAVPLWTCHVLPVRDNQTFILWRIHHALADGASVYAFFARLSDAPLHEYIPPRARPPDEVEVSTWHKIRQQVHRVVQSLWLYSIKSMRLALVPEPRTRLTQPSGRSKRLFYTTNYSVTATKGIARHLGMRATVNDVFLSCITGALRTMLMEEASMDLNEDEKRERAAVVDPSCVIRAGISVDLRPPWELPAEPDNQFSCLLVELPLGEACPVRRLRRVARTMNDAKYSLERYFTYGISMMLAQLPPRILAKAVAYLTSHASVAISNVRGPPHVMYFGGHALESLNGYVPPPPHVNMGIAIYSMADALGVSVQVDANVFRRPERFLVYLKREYVELQKRSAAMHTTFHEVDAD